MDITGCDRWYTDGENDMEKFKKRGFGKTKIVGNILLII
jgi:hypothetical protein